MKLKSFFLSFIILVAIASYAQKALPINVKSVLSKVPSPTNCKGSFEMCTTETINGIISVKDAGPEVNQLQDSLGNYLKKLTASSMASSYGGFTSSSVPSQEQINQTLQNAMQMQTMSPQQAMQMAKQKQLQNSSSSTNDSAYISAMQEFVKAQNALGQLNILINEFGGKVTQLDDEHRQKIKMIQLSTNSCPEVKVQGADLAAPECSCLKPIYIDYYNKRIMAEDKYLEELSALLEGYLPKLRVQISIIDNFESKANYGDGVTIPTIKSQVALIQNSALSYISGVANTVENTIKESAGEYCSVVNVNNGHLPVFCQ